MTPNESAVAPLADAQHRYTDNLAALYAYDAGLAKSIDTTPFSSIPPLEPTRDGNWTVRVTTDDGRSIYAHSRYHPSAEAQTLVNRPPPISASADPQQDATPQASDDPEDADDLHNATFVLSGLGLGYHVVELERRYLKPIIIVLEPDLAMIKAAFCICNLTPVLRAQRLFFLTTLDKATIHARLRPLSTSMLLDLRMLALPHTNRCQVEFYRGMRAALRDMIAYMRTQIISLVRTNRIASRNVAYNLWAFIANPGVESLTNRAAGYPAILVSAGPSLAKVRDQLPAARDRAVFIGVQTVLKTLLGCGLPPHFVTTLDYHQISAQFFEGIEDFRNVTLVADAKVAWQVLDTFRGRMHLLHHDFVHDLLGPCTPERGSLPMGSTVAHLSLYLAWHLGCDPIILVGQDLSFSDGLFYPPGTQIERTWYPELERYTTIEMKQWERIVRRRGGLRAVEDIHGRTVYADDQLYTYAEQFEADFAKSRSRVILASEGGRRLAGAEVMTFQDAVAQFCSRQLPPDIFAPLLSHSAPPPDKDAYCAQLRKTGDGVREVRAIADETRTLLKRLADLVDQPAEFNRLVSRVDDLRARMRRHQHICDLVSRVSQEAELRRVSADRGIHDDVRETPARARRRLRRDQAYVDAFIDGCDFVLDILPETLRRIQARLP